jgi:hypothetical protein
MSDVIEVGYWKDVVAQIFKTEVPERKAWESFEDIFEILKTIGSVKEANHTFFPTVGGFDLIGCQRSQDKEALYLVDKGSKYSTWPLSLTFECIEGDLLWSYFRLEQDLAKRRKTHASGNGVFVIFPKYSVYNDMPETYVDRIHDKMNAQDFRGYITNLRSNN